MFESKYSNFLTIILIIVIIAIVGLLAFLGYDFYRKYYIDKDARGEADHLEEQIKNELTSNTTNENTTNENVTNPFETMDNTATYNNSSGNNTNKENTYKGFPVVGIIEIPKTKIKYPLLKAATKESMEVSIAVLMSPGVNEVGNTIIQGHNYKNGLFFSKNNQIENGDKVYITDLSGRKITYTVYNKYVTTSEDAEYMIRDTAGKREISLSTCTDDAKNRIVIWAKED